MAGLELAEHKTEALLGNSKKAVEIAKIANTTAALSRMIPPSIGRPRQLKKRLKGVSTFILTYAVAAWNKALVTNANKKKHKTKYTD